MTPSSPPLVNPDPPEDGSSRLARQRKVLAEIQARHANNPARKDALIQRFMEQERTTPEQEMGPRSVPERIAQVGTALAKGVPGANRAIAGYRGMVDLATGREPDIAGEMESQRRDIADIPAVPRGALELVGGAGVPLGPLKAGIGTGVGALAKRAAATTGNAAMSGAAAGASHADLEGLNAGVGAAGGAPLAVAANTAIAGLGRGASLVRAAVRPKAASEAAIDKMLALAADEGKGDPAFGLWRIKSEVAQRRADGGDPMAFEVFGPRGVNTARATKNAPFSAAAKELPEAVSARAESAFDRAAGAVRAGAGIADEDPGFIVDRMTAYRTEATRPLFKRAEQEAAQSGGVGSGPASSFVADQVEKNPLMRQVVEGAKINPALVDAPPTSYEVLDAAYKRINDLTRDARLAGDLTKVQDLDGIRKPLLDALTEIAPSYRQAAQAFAEESVPLNSFVAGLDFSDLTPYEMRKVFATGKLPSGYAVDPEAFKVGTAQRLIRDIEQRASSPSLAGVATDKNPLLGLNNRELDAQIRESLGDGYDEMVPTFREIIREMKSAQAVTGGSNTTAQLADDPDFIQAGLERMSGGIGFGKEAALRRFTMGGLAGAVKGVAQAGAGKRASETGRALATRGQPLDDLITSLTKALNDRGNVPREGFSLTRGLRDTPENAQLLPAMIRALSGSAGVGAASGVR